MDNIFEVIAATSRDNDLIVLCYGLIVARFLLNSGRVLKAIELCKECFILLNNQAFKQKETVINFVCRPIYTVMMRGYSLINDYTSAIQCCRNLLVVLRKCGKRDEEGGATLCLAIFYCEVKEYAEAKYFCEKALSNMLETGDRKGEACCYEKLGTVFQSLNEYCMAEECLQKALAIRREVGDRQGEAEDYGKLGLLLQSLGDYGKAEKHIRKSVSVLLESETGDREGEGWCSLIHQSSSLLPFDIVALGLAVLKDPCLSLLSYGLLVANFLLNSSRVLEAIELCKECFILLKNKVTGTEQNVMNRFYIGIYSKMLKGYLLINDHNSAIECCRNFLVLLHECGERAKEGEITSQLAELYCNQRKYKEAKCLYEKALSIRVEVGDREGEASSYRNLGAVFESLCECEKAKECFQKALAIRKEVGNRGEEASVYEALGSLFASRLGEYNKAENYIQKAVSIMIEIGDRKGEASCYGDLGYVSFFLGELDKAKEYFQKTITIRKEIGDKQGEGRDYGGLGAVFITLCRYDKAEEYCRKALEIGKEVGDKEGEATAYQNLGAVFLRLGEREKGEKCLKNSFAIAKEIGRKEGQSLCNALLGKVFKSLGNCSKAEEYYQNALAISKDIGDRQKEAESYASLGELFRSLGKNVKAQEYIQQSLAIHKEIGDKEGEASCYRALACAVLTLGEYAKVEKYLNHALAIRQETGNRPEEANDYGKLGDVFSSLGECVKAKEYHGKALAICKQIGDIEAELKWSVFLSLDLMKMGNKREAFKYLLDSFQKSEDVRSFLGDSDLLKISFLDNHDSPYVMLSTVLKSVKLHVQALLVLEHGRARALADLMSAQYSVDKQATESKPHISINITEEIDSTFLYISYCGPSIDLWVLKAGKPIQFQTVNVNDCFVSKGEIFRRTVEDVFGRESFRRFHPLSQELCEDRSLPSLNSIHTKRKSPQEDVQEAAFRLVEIEDGEEENRQLDPPLAQCYKIFIAPVVDLLDGHELIIVPDRCLFEIPFAALSDESGKPLSETFRIRIVPSLTSLKLIHDSPANYHSQTGALIVGEPKVSQVYYRGCVEKLCPLPAARKEAQMVGRLLGV